MLERILSSPICSAADAQRCVPDSPGYYAIFVYDINILSSTLSRVLPSNGLVYVGMAGDSLRDRLVKQELYHKGCGTFFRSLGATLGYRPQVGSISHCKKANNFRFTDEDTRKIVGWIAENLAISWLCEVPLESEEKRVIRELRPVFNIQNNPDKCKEVIASRKDCRDLAKQKCG